MVILGLTLTAWSSLIGALCMAVLAGIMLVLGNQRMHFIWAAFCIAVFVYASGFYLVASVHTPSEAQFWWKIEYIGTIIIPFIFFHFVLDFTKHLRRWIIILSYSLAGVLIYLDLTTNLMIDQVKFMFGELYYNYPAAPLHPYLMIVYIVFVLVAEYMLFVAQRDTKDPLFRARVHFLFLGTGIGFLGGVMNFLPVYGIEIHPITNLTVVFGSIFIGFTILRYRLFNIKVVTAQLLTLILAVFVLARLVVSSSVQEVVINSTLLIVVSIVSTFLIKSVRKEVETREKIQILATDLEKANKRLTDLDKQKSEFVSFASHQLRAPLTAMKGYSSLLLEGDMGKLTDQAKEGVGRIYESTSTMVNIVDSYLNISRIELGTMKYTFDKLDLKDMVQNVIAELKPNIEKAGIAFSFEAKNDGTDYNTNADKDKLKQVIANLIDNSVKYTPSGSVRVSLARDDVRHKLVFQLKDTGIGIDPQVLPLLFQKFSRAESANKVNIKGTGLGLYVAKEIVKAHHGDIRAESPGEGKGSTFTVELDPIK